MPRRPPSSIATTRSRRSTNVLALATPFEFANVSTRPFCCRTYHFVSSPGGCRISKGCWNVRFGNTRVELTDTPNPGSAVARHVVFDGRESRPPVAGGGGLFGGVSELPPPPPPQAAMARHAQTTAPKAALLRRPFATIAVFEANDVIF